MTYNVFGGTLSLTQSINQSILKNQNKNCVLGEHEPALGCHQCCVRRGSTCRHPLSKRHGLALTAFVAWRVDISHAELSLYRQKSVSAQKDASKT